MTGFILFMVAAVLFIVWITDGGDVDNDFF